VTSRSILEAPRRGHLAPAREIVHDNNQLMVVVAVQHFDVDAGIGHPTREQTELTRHVLLQSLNDDFPFREDLDVGGFKRLSGGSSVSEEEMSGALATDDPSSSAFDADTGTS
jgi:hypothetical protein